MARLLPTPRNLPAAGNPDTLPAHSLHPPLCSLGEEIIPLPTLGPVRVRNRSFKIIYFLSGNVSLLLNRRESLEIKEGDVLVLRDADYEIHRSRRCPASRVHLLEIVFDRRFLDDRLAAGAHGLLRELVELSFPGTALLKSASNSSITSLVFELRNTREQLGQSGRTGWLKLHSLVVILIYELAAVATNSMKQEEKIIHDVHHFLLENLSRKALSLDQIAWQFNLSGDHLNRIYRSHTGKTVFQELREIRMNKARSLLLQVEHSLAKIASTAGYTSVSSFCHAFREAVGCSPSDYRSRYNARALLVETSFSDVG
ncbi:MAG TPA: helix-turn-helix transcriptional regulator [Chthoniobacteraceae bacterium]|nr:helix-turn-helix transcriptional regulator [Chthoniobacteraceae bacterium]